MCAARWIDTPRVVMDANSALPPPQVGESFEFMCSTGACAEYRYCGSESSDVVTCVNRHYVGAGNFRCSRCNRMYVVCTLCRRSDGPFIFLVKIRDESTSYANKATEHFNSPGHLAKFSSLHNEPLPALACNNGSSAGAAAASSVDTFGGGDYAPAAFEEEATVIASSDDLRHILTDRGDELHHSDFSSSRLFPAHMEAASSYYRNEHFSPGSGREALVRNALRRDAFDERVDPDETDINLALHEMCAEVGVDKAGRLVEIIDRIRRKDKCSIYHSIKIPSDRLEVRTMYLEGARSISQSLPLPPIIELDNDLTYCRIEDIVRHALASDFDNDIDLVYNQVPNLAYSHPIDSPRSAEVAQRCHLMRSGLPTAAVMLHYWEDDADTNTTKKDRGSVHISTVTICSKRSSKSLTYVVSIGAKDADHELVRRRLVSDLNSLSGAEPVEMYHGGMGTAVPVYAAVHSCIVDRVARGALSGQAQGNGKYSALWGYALNLQASHAGIPLCVDCLSSILAGVAVSSCESCDGWSYRLHSQLLQCPKPPNYPPGELQEDELLLRPMKVTGKLIRDKIQFTSEKLQRGAWTQRQADAYLRTVGLSQLFRDAIIDCAIDERPPPCPSFLNLGGCDVDAHIDTVMHLFFLGICKYCVKMMASLCKLRGITSRHHNAIAPAVAEMSSFKLEWLKIQPWNHGKLGGLVGENFLALARIAPWLVLSLPSLMDEGGTNEAEEPQGPVETWLLPQCKRWLGQRKLDSKESNEEWMRSLPEPPEPFKMNRSLYRIRIRELMDREGGPPEPVTRVLTESKRPVLAFRLLQVLSGRLMAEVVTEETKREAGCFARLFLQSFHLWDKEQRAEAEGQDATTEEDDRTTSSGVPSWVKASNFASLVNLVERVMGRYGSLRKLWEGGSLGEGAVKDVREFAQRGMRDGWAKSAHRRSMQKMQGYNLPSRSRSRSDTVDVESSSHRRKMYHLYKEDMYQATHRINRSVPMSGVVLGLSENKIQFGLMRSHEKVIVVVANAKVCSKYGLDFFSFEVTGEKDITAAELNEYCVFLPLIENGTRSHSLITSEWHELFENIDGSQALVHGSGITLAMY